jgi:hypothetical protein
MLLNEMQQEISEDNIEIEWEIETDQDDQEEE